MILQKDGWTTIAIWGAWHLQVDSGCHKLVLVEPSIDYWIDSTRWDEPNWLDHMGRKPWCVYRDFDLALQFCRSLKINDQRALCRSVLLLRRSYGQYPFPIDRSANPIYLDVPSPKEELNR